MRLLYIAHGGFGDVAFTTSWPRLWSEQGYEVDVFLMRHTGNPFHMNPYVNQFFEADKKNSGKVINSMVDLNVYDKILTIDNNNGGMISLYEVLKDVKTFKKLDKKTRPPIALPEFYFSDSEKESVKFYNNRIIIHPLCSHMQGNSRNISFSLIKEFSKHYKCVVAYGGRPFLPPYLKAKDVDFFWEGYNYFDDKSGAAIGKLLALVSLCDVGIHGWSGSLVISMGFKKPFVVVVPKNTLKHNASASAVSTLDQYQVLINKSRKFNCLQHSVWCITEDSDIVSEAVNRAREGYPSIYDKKWKNL